MKRRDVAGLRFGRLTAERCARFALPTLWRCRCDCGRRAEVQLGHLTSGHTQSCGCLAAEVRARNLAASRRDGNPYDHLALTAAWGKSVQSKEIR